MQLLQLRSTIRRHHLPQRAVLSQICCFGERKVLSARQKLVWLQFSSIAAAVLLSRTCQKTRRWQLHLDIKATTYTEFETFKNRTWLLFKIWELSPEVKMKLEAKIRVHGRESSSDSPAVCENISPDSTHTDMWTAACSGTATTFHNSPLSSLSTQSHIWCSLISMQHITCYLWLVTLALLTGDRPGDSGSSRSDSCTVVNSLQLLLKMSRL